ncbi:MAG: enoyl-CoA hydratase/isomerase family protein [Hyphomicrobiaceae bacterium]
MTTHSETSEPERQTDERMSVKLEQQGAAAIATLGQAQPDGNPDFHAALMSWFPKLARDPGVYAVVVRQARQSTTSPPSPAIAPHEATIAADLRLNWLHECFSKPTVSLLDGSVDASHLRLTLNGTHRVAGDEFKLQFAPPGDARIPWLGLTHALARLPHAIGTYIALTAPVLDRADALALNLITHCLPSADFATVVHELADANPVDPILDDRHVDPGPPPLLKNVEKIEKYFATPDLQDTVARLAKPSTGDQEWAGITLRDIQKNTPLAAAIMFSVIRKAAALDMRQCLIEEYRVASRLSQEETSKRQTNGLNKNNNISNEWGNNALPERLDQTRLAPYFTRPERGDIELLDRKDMQEHRV